MRKDYITSELLSAYVIDIKAALGSGFDEELIRNTCSLLEHFIDRIEMVNEDAPLTAGWDVQAFAYLHNKAVSPEAIEKIFKQLSLCAREIALRTGMVDLRIIPVFDYIDRVYSQAKGQVKYYEYYKYGIYKLIIGEMYNNIDTQKKSFEKQLLDWRVQLDDSKKAVTDIQQQLESQHKQYNFVGLSQAFANLLQKKKRERAWLVAFAVGISLALLIVPFSASWIGAVLLGYTTTFSAIISSADIPGKVLIAMPFLAIEIVLIYYFRVFLNNYYNVKAQVIQLELRNSLCQFVEGYIDFAKKIGPVSLSSFESLIYSDLDRPTSSNPGVIDSESLTKIIEAVKKG